MKHPVNANQTSVKANNSNAQQSAGSSTSDFQPPKCSNQPSTNSNQVSTCSFPANADQICTTNLSQENEYEDPADVYKEDLVNNYLEDTTNTKSLENVNFEDDGQPTTSRDYQEANLSEAPTEKAPEQVQHVVITSKTFH